MSWEGFEYVYVCPCGKGTFKEKSKGDDWGRSEAVGLVIDCPRCKERYHSVFRSDNHKGIYGEWYDIVLNEGLKHEGDNVHGPWSQVKNDVLYNRHRLEVLPASAGLVKEMSKKTAEIAPEDEPLAGTWQTEDYDKIRLTGGKLPEEGVVIVPMEMATKTGSNGDFRVVKMTLDGKDGDLVFSSEKLTKIFDAHWDEMVGKRVSVAGRGSGFDRNYTVKLV